MKLTVLKATLLASLAAYVSLGTHGSAFAQSGPDEHFDPNPYLARAIPLNTGGVADMPAEASFLDMNGKVTVRNISQATITPVLPDPAVATGAAVLILPGGGFAMLSMENEGWPIAQWFADRGVAAFVVKYRINATPASEEAFKAEGDRVIARIVSGAPRENLPTPPQSIADGTAALRFVRAHAAEYNIDARRVGMLGFSAGAMTTLAVSSAVSAEEEPAFMGSIYGPMVARPVPEGAPPLFIALAEDDPIFGREGFGLVGSWQAARAPVELHFYQKGGHGFGAASADLTAFGWRQAFLDWLRMNRFLTPPAS